MHYKIYALILASLVFISCSTVNHASTLETVDQVDLAQYAGKWFEIASFPNSFQKNFTCTTASYTPTQKGYVIVENRCNRDSINGKAS